MLASLLATWFAAAPAPAASSPAPQPADLAALGPASRKPAHEKADRAALDLLFKALDAALAKGDAEAYAGAMDFPVTIVTDDATGASTSVSLDHDAFVKAMAPYLVPSPHLKVASKRSVTLLSDALASVVDTTTFTLGKTKATSSSEAVVVARPAGWRIKVLTEPGWGELLVPKPAATP